MKKIFSSGKVYIGKSKVPNSGRGVFALRNIKKGETIESCPIIEIPEDHTEYLSQSVLTSYLFYFGRNKNRSGIALGFGSIYNHSYKPNAKFKIKEKEKVIDFIALKNITKDEEITFNYKGFGNQNKNPLWFEKV